MTRPSVLFRLSRFLYLAYYFTVSTWIFQRTFLWNFMMFCEHDIEQFIVTQRSSSESIRNQSKPQPRQWMDIWISIYLEIRSVLRCYLSAFYFRSHLEKKLIKFLSSVDHAKCDAKCDLLVSTWTETNLQRCRRPASEQDFLRTTNKNCLSCDKPASQFSETYFLFSASDFDLSGAGGILNSTESVFLFKRSWRPK